MTYTRQQYVMAAKWLRSVDPDTAKQYARDYQDRSLYGLGRAFAEAAPDTFEEIMEELLSGD